MPPPKSPGTLFHQLETIPATDEPVSHVALEEDTSPPPEEGRYSRRRPLGEGGMGLVDLVHDRSVGRNVALKEMKGRGRAEEIARFEREARLQGQLEHPAIVPVYDMGRSPDGAPYFTMKRVRGDSLAAILALIAEGDEQTRQRWSLRKLLVAFSQLCLAAHYAHERGVVHRDIKPANVMLGSYGEVYLLDWGIAKVSGEAEPSHPEGPVRTDGRDHTAFGMIVGTVSTMAPEQASGQGVDARADVYSLGAVLFEILTSRPLHEKIDNQSIAKIVDGVEARPSVRAPDAGVAPELEQLCVAATKRDREDRLQSALAIHEALEAYLDGDRDLALRRAMARKHADVARETVEAGASSPEEEAAMRTRVLGDVGRALALDPESADALRILLRMLTEPPRHVPREVQEGQRVATLRNIRRGGIAGSVIYGYISLNAVATYLLGVHDWPVFVTAHALWGGALVASIVTALRPSYPALVSMFLFGAAASVWVTNVYGPFLLIPTFLTMHAVLFALVRERRLRVAFVSLACVLWTVSVFGEASGLFYDTVRFTGSGVLVQSPVIDLPERSTTIYLYAAVLASILVPAFVIGSLRSSYDSADERMRLQAWQLHRMIPDEAARTLEGALD